MARRVLLDISLLADEVISPKKLQQALTGSDFVLQVPTALAEMIDKEPDSLVRFICAYKRRWAWRREHEASIQGRIELLRKRPETVNELNRQEAIQIVKRIREDFAPLVEQGRIERYSRPQGFGDDMLRQRLRGIYQTELDTVARPLFDEYYLDVLHGMTVGIAHSPQVCSLLISIGTTTLQILSQLAEAAMIELDEWARSGAIGARRFAEDYIRAKRQFVESFVREDWGPFVLEKGSEIVLSLALLSSVDPTVLGISTVVYFFADGYRLRLVNPWSIIAIVAIFVFLLFLLRSPNRLFGPARPPTIAPTIVSSEMVPCTPAVEIPPGIPTVVSVWEAGQVSIPAYSVIVTPILTVLPTPPPLSTPAADLAKGFLYRVHEGDTIFGLSRRFGVPVQTIIETNHLPNPNYLTVGQVLYVPVHAFTLPNMDSLLQYAPAGSRLYVVTKGDTMYSLARRFGVSIAQLMAVNNLSDPNYLRVGQLLIIPPGS